MASSHPDSRRKGRIEQCDNGLRVYAAWVAASDRKAAELLASRLPKRIKSNQL